MHEVIDATVISVVLTGGVAAAVRPRGEVLELSEPVTEVSREERELEKTSGLAVQPVAEGG